MTAIEVKYAGPTGSRGTRMRATYARGVVNSISVAYDHGQSERDNAAYAAMALVRKLDLKCGEDYWLAAEINGGWVFVPSNADQFTRFMGVESK